MWVAGIRTAAAVRSSGDWRILQNSGGTGDRAEPHSGEHDKGAPQRTDISWCFYDPYLNERTKTGATRPREPTTCILCGIQAENIEISVYSFESFVAHVRVSFASNLSKSWPQMCLNHTSAKAQSG